MIMLSLVQKQFYYPLWLISNNSCMATSLGTILQNTIEHRNTPTMPLCEETICSHPPGNNTRQCWKPRHGHTGGWGRSVDTTNCHKLTKHLSCSPQTWRFYPVYKSSLISFAHKLGWHPHNLWFLNSHARHSWIDIRCDVISLGRMFQPAMRFEETPTPHSIYFEWQRLSAATEEMNV